jgi:hypothetical protein
MLANVTLGEWFDFHFPMIATLAAMAIAYAFGEGIGAWPASVSAAVTAASFRMQPNDSKDIPSASFYFWGKTKKITYSSPPGRLRGGSDSGADGDCLYRGGNSEFLYLP